jgi:hypothetical protein
MTNPLLTVASILLPTVIVLVGIASAFIAMALLLGLSEIVADEARGWLEATPRGILRLAAMRLPPDLRHAIYDEEWRPELLCKMRKGEERPISRLVIGIWYALDMARGAGRVGRELEGVRDNEPEVRHVQDSDTVTALERQDVYVDEYQGPARAGGLPVTHKGIEITGKGIFNIGATLTVGGSATPLDQEA